MIHITKLTLLTKLEFMKHLTLFVLLVFCSGYNLFGQTIDEDLMMDNDVPGYIITQRGDTIKGKVKVANRAKNQVRVKFTPQSKFKSTTYKAKDKDLLGYGYQTIENNGSQQKVYKYRHFLVKDADQPPVPFSSSTVFMEIKAMGSVSLFSYYVESNTQVESTYLHYYFMEAKYSKNTNDIRQRKVLREDFERTVESFTEDCPAIRNKIGSAYDYSNLDRIIIEYNSCQTEKIEGGCGECAIEAERKRQAAERLKKEREQEQKLEQFKSSNRDNDRN